VLVPALPAPTEPAFAGSLHAKIPEGGAFGALLATPGSWFAALPKTARGGGANIGREDETESPSRPTFCGVPGLSLTHMKRTLLLILLALGLILLAAGAWAVQGLRWAFGGGRDRRERLATA
jgi:hypothetical protein